MTITLTREEAQSVLDALGSCEEDWIYDGEDEHPVDVYDKEKVGKAFALLKNRLSAPEPEPDKYLMEVECTKCGAKQDGILTVNAPPQREWVGLTEREYEAMAEQYVTNCYFDTLEYAKAIEAKLKEKNT